MMTTTDVSLLSTDPISGARANGFTPDAQLLALHHQGRRVLEGDLAAARARHLATQQEAKRVTKAQRRAKRDTAQDGSAA